jgi:hypothetical protein
MARQSSFEIPLQEHDLGRLLSGFAHPLIAAIAEDLPRVAEGGEAIMKTVKTRRGVWHLVRITPYRREGASDRGLAVAVLDVTALRQTESVSKESVLSAI